jgi:hypothetical protein
VKCALKDLLRLRTKLKGEKKEKCMPLFLNLNDLLPRVFSASKHSMLEFLNTKKRGKLSFGCDLSSYRFLSANRTATMPMTMATMTAASVALSIIE